jgi:hypothetical protein
MITYKVSEFNEEDVSVEVTYTNSSAETHIRTLFIPKNPDGTVNQTEWDNILESQLKNVEHKASIGVISFTNPTVETATLLPEE